MSKTTYKGTDVWFREHTTGNLPEDLQRICFCCRKKVNNCKSVLVINNHAILPNTLMHSECFEEWKTKTDDLLENIESSYNQWKQLNDIFG